jgi:glycosyltransferase involved in cell wall biosynthesis
VNERAPLTASPLSFIVHCHLRWDFVWQRPQQIFSRIAARHPVLFLEDPVFETERSIEPHLLITEPHRDVHRVVPVLSDAHAGVDAHCEIVLPLVRHALRKHGRLAGRFKTAAQWFYSPMTAPVLLGKFAPGPKVYDCMDELANFRFAPADIAVRERFLLAHADVVFTGGHALYESKRRHHDRVSFFGCGVDFQHYSRARSATRPVAPDVAALPKPVLGYFGVIDERLDYDLIDRLAHGTKGSIAMVGPFAKVDPAELPRRHNIHWLGQRSYAELPALVKGFDVCLMPFALNEATQFINPTKTLEYMAAGKHVVSTAVPDVVRHFSSIVAVAANAEEFCSAARQACETPRVDLIARGIERAKEHAWDTIVNAMVQQVHEAHIGASAEFVAPAASRPAALTGTA